jgi:monoamine oxidase
VPGGHASSLGRLLDVHYSIEYGTDTTGQSALNLIYLLAYQPKPVTFSVFGQSDERYKMAGGIDLVTTAIANHLGWNNINLEWILRSLVRDSDGMYTLNFDKGRSVRAEAVLLALPFSAIRGRIDYSRAGFSPLKQRAIQEQGAAHNLKMALQFDTRYWNRQGPWGISNGNLATDLGFQYGWDATRGVPGASGLLINYTGGSVTDAQLLRHPYGNASDNNVVRDAQAFLAQLEVLFPGITQHWNGKVCSTKSHLDPNYGSAYGNYLPGQYQLMCGYERVPENNVFFAGEHSSVDYFGFFEGAAAEGWWSAGQILSALGLASLPARVGLVRRTA